MHILNPCFRAALALAVVCLIYLSPTALAEQAPEEAPARAVEQEAIDEEQIEEMLDLYMSAMREGDYDTMSQLMHPDDMERFKELFVTMARMADAQGQFNQVAMIVGGVDSLDALEQMPASIVFSKLMTTLTQLIPELGGALAGAEMSIIGYVPEQQEPDDQGEQPEPLVHVVHRVAVEMNGVTIRSVDVVTMQRYEDSYLLLIDEQINGVIESFKAQFGG